MTKARDNATQGGLVLLNTTSFSGASSVIVDNVFSSTYDNYKLKLYITATSGTEPDLIIYGRVGSTDTTTNYVSNLIYQYSSSSFGANITSNGRIGNTSTSYPNWSVTTTELFTPNLARRTIWTSDSHYVNASGVPYQLRYAGYHDTDAQFTGIKLLPSTGTFSGVFNIYGYKKN